MIQEKWLSPELLHSFWRESNIAKFKKELETKDWIIKNETFIEELQNLKQIQFTLNTEDFFHRLLTLFEISILHTQSIDRRFTDAQISLFKSIAKKYCENGKCISKEKYSCCYHCVNQTSQGCKNKPNICLSFFCPPVLEKLSKRIKKLIRLDGMETFILQMNEKISEEI